MLCRGGAIRSWQASRRGPQATQQEPEKGAACLARRSAEVERQEDLRCGPELAGPYGRHRCKPRRRSSLAAHRLKHPQARGALPCLASSLRARLGDGPSSKVTGHLADTKLRGRDVLGEPARPSHAVDTS